MKKINPKKLIIIKAGSSLTTLPSGLPNLKFIKSISEQIFRLYKKGFHIVLVSSGAIAQGMKIWNLTSKPKSVDFLQALSASGQIGLINNYQKDISITFLTSSLVLQKLSASDGEPTIIESTFARDIATFRRLGSNRKSSPRGASSPELEVSENIEINASCP